MTPTETNIVDGTEPRSEFPAAHLSSRRRWAHLLSKPALAPAVVGAVAAVAAVSAARQSAYSGDDVSQILYVRDLRDGATRVFFGSDNFILRLPLAFLTDGWIAEGRGYLVIISALLVTLGAIAAVAFRRADPGQRPLDQALFIAAVAWAFANFGVAMTISRPFIRNVELGLALALVFVVDRLVNRKTSPFGLVLFASALALLLYNDPYFTYLVGLPLVAVVGAWAVLRPRRENRLLAGAAVAGCAASFVLPRLGELVGFTAHPAPVHLIDQDQIGAALRGTHRATATLGLNVHGPYPVGRLVAALNITVCVVLAGVALWGVLQLIRRRQALRPSQLILPLAAVLPFCAYVAGGSSLVDHTARYVVLTPVALAACITLVRMPKWTAIAVAALLVVATTANLGLAVRSLTCPETSPSCRAFVATAIWNLEERFADDLERAGVTKLFGDYWQMNITGYASDGGIAAVPIVCIGDQVGIWNWNVSTARIYQAAARSHVLLGGQFVSPCEAHIQSQLGTPIEVVTIGNRTLLAYDGDISRRMPRIDP